jgi:methylthioribose-1-phosphate isomerase
MKIAGKHYRTVWMEGREVKLIDQTLLPFQFEVFTAKNYKDVCHAIRTMVVRGAGAIGATAGYGMALAFLQSDSKDYIEQARKELDATRPTARNLFYATERVFNAGILSPKLAIEVAEQIALEDENAGKNIGIFGNTLIENGFRIMTHCNAGWLGFVDYGSALSPIYRAHDKGKKIFVYVDETRPRGQGARLTAWELQNEGVPYAVVPDNAGAHLMSKGLVDMVIVGADRIARNGDSANKIGTLEKAIAAKHYGIPFYVAAPFSTFDMNCLSGAHIPIEERDPDEVLWQTGPDKNGGMHTIQVCTPGSKVMNPAFDVTPAELITAIITEKGVIKPTEEAIFALNL